jgi:hypothetical protein
LASSAESRGIAVSLALSTYDEVATAFKLSQTIQNAVIVERFIEGTEYRLLVVDNRVVAATGAVEFSVTGNGRYSLRALVAATVGGDDADLWMADTVADHPAFGVCNDFLASRFETLDQDKHVQTLRHHPAATSKAGTIRSETAAAATTGTATTTAAASVGTDPV